MIRPLWRARRTLNASAIKRLRSSLKWAKNSSISIVPLKLVSTRSKRLRKRAASRSVTFRASIMRRREFSP